MQFIKRFTEWILLKEKIDRIEAHPPLFKEGEIWWCAVGENVGVEVNGKNRAFSRTVLVFKKLSTLGFIGVPLSTKLKTGSWYVTITVKEKRVIANISQIKTFSSKRIYSKLATLDESDFEKTKKAFTDFFC